MYCPRCGVELLAASRYCPNCGANLDQQVSTKSRNIAGVIALIMGSFGIHNFYLGYKKKAIIQLCLGIGGLLTFGVTSTISGIWGICECISLLVGKINTDGEGKTLMN